MKDNNGKPLEETPTDMHWRLAKEFARIEYEYKLKELSRVNRNTAFHEELDKLSPFGRTLLNRRNSQNQEDITQEFFNYFDHFKYIVPQGSIMSNLGNDFVFGSLSNCFVIASPEDSYGGIMRADEELVQLMKRRGGVGTTLNYLRPTRASVTNSSRSSTGVPSFAERFSNSTREVGQDGRRGALMLLLSVMHPDIFKFVKMKSDRTKVTGANVSVMFTDDFMKKVERNEDFLCRFPLDIECEELLDEEEHNLPYNQLIPIDSSVKPFYVMKIRAKELWEDFINMSWDNAEPGAAYTDRIQDYSPDGVYERFKPVACNPCGEIWMSYYDACRLIAQNLFSIVKNPFTTNSQIDFEKLYEVSYMQQRLGDNLIDLEIEYIDRILDKLEHDPEPSEIKDREINLWSKIKDTTQAGRRTGNGFTGLGDMLAALDLGYDTDMGLKVVEAVLRVKMQAELDATIDMAILRGTFEGHNSKLEFELKAMSSTSYQYGAKAGKNSFFQMLVNEFPEQANRMAQYGRRNVSWSTVAPTGTVSLMTQTTGGMEPLFKAYYIRRKKINPNDKDVRIDFTDQNGDKWQEYPVLHPKFGEWIKQKMKNDLPQIFNQSDNINIEELDSKTIKNLFENSPWYGSEADNISWKNRIKMQSIIQKYTSNSISSTINLPNDVSKETVHNIFLEAWKHGLKGVTVYRDGCRTGVMISDQKDITTKDNFGYTDSIKRPELLDADYYCVIANGSKYAVVVGLLNGNPYELFAFEEPLCEGQLKGQIRKVESGVYSFVSPNYTIENLQLSSERSDEKLLTRWVSLLLRHGANPKFIAQQVEKSEVTVTSFAKVVARVLKNYIPDEQIKGELCPECQQPTMIYQEGCKRCQNCGSSKC
jgi:ribonucleoside-diphosphate reductase alpha chain